MQLRLLVGLAHQSVSSSSSGGTGNGSSRLQIDSLQQDPEADANAGAADPDDVAASPAAAERGNSGPCGRVSQPVASLPAHAHSPHHASGGGKLRGAQRRKAKRPAQKSGEAPARQPLQQQHSGPIGPSAEEAAELQLSDGDDIPAAVGRHRQRLGRGAADGLTGTWEPLPADSGGQLTAAVAAAAAGPEPIPLETSSATTSGCSPGRDAPAADGSVQQRPSSSL